MIVASWFLCKKENPYGYKKNKKSSTNVQGNHYWRNIYDHCFLVSMKKENLYCTNLPKKRREITLNCNLCRSVNELMICFKEFAFQFVGTAWNKIYF